MTRLYALLVMEWFLCHPWVLWGVFFLVGVAIGWALLPPRVVYYEMGSG